MSGFLLEIPYSVLREKRENASCMHTTQSQSQLTGSYQWIQWVCQIECYLFLAPAARLTFFICLYSLIGNHSSVPRILISIVQLPALLTAFSRKFDKRGTALALVL